jgi:hypothetical protein
MTSIGIIWYYFLYISTGTFCLLNTSTFLSSVKVGGFPIKIQKMLQLSDIRVARITYKNTYHTKITRSFLAISTPSRMVNGTPTAIMSGRGKGGS